MSLQYAFKHAREMHFTEICKHLEKLGIDIDYIKFKTPDKDLEKLDKLTFLLKLALFKLETEKHLL